MGKAAMPIVRPKKKEEKEEEEEKLEVRDVVSLMRCFHIPSFFISLSLSLSTLSYPLPVSIPFPLLPGVGRVLVPVRMR